MNLEQPGWLILLALLPLIAIGGVLVARTRRRQWDAFAAARLRSALIRRSSAIPRWLALFFLMAGAAALIAGLARPQGDAGTKTEKTIGRNVMIALDLSRSMRVNDVKPDRLSQAKIVIYELLDALPSDRVGLIGFAGSPYLHAPLTVDHAAVRETVEQIDETWAPVGGSDLGAAIQLAIKTLKETGQKNNALVILSDGEEHEGDLDPMIAEAERSGVYIFAIGVGTEDGGFVPDAEFPMMSGKPVISRLQTGVMQKLATETRGRFAIAGGGTDIPSMVKSAVQELDAFEVQGRERRVAVEFYQWLVLPGILFLMASIVAGTRWKAVQTATIIAGAFFLTPKAEASDISRARDALNGGQFEKARDDFRKLAEKAVLPGRASRYRIGEGTAAYRAEDFRGARSAFSGALLSDDPEVAANAHLGMGNTLFQLGWQGLANETYPHAADEIPDLNRFDTLVRERLARLKSSEPQEGSDNEEFVRLDSLMTNWADAVRHYRSALKNDPANEVAKKNQQTTLIYLNRLQELLKEDKEQTEQSIPPPQSGKGPPQEGEGESGEGEPQDGDGSGQGDENQEGGGGEDEKDKPGDNGKKPDDKKGKDGDGDKGDPNESPEDRARRLLSDNADLEHGPLNPGRFEPRTPEKDW